MRELLKRGAPRLKRVVWWSSLYPSLSLVVLLLEYRSELTKIDRGFFTDTFSPFFFTHLLTFPASSWRCAWHGYPVDFDAHAFRALVARALPGEVANMLVQYAAIVVVLSLIAVCLEWLDGAKSNQPSAQP